jgi:NAD(P)H-hydrate epimerase
MDSPLVFSREQCRLVDRLAVERYGMPSIVLMENAGRGVVDRIQRLGVVGPVLVCCGKGNNAGDGFVIARHLDVRALPVRVMIWADPSSLTGDAAINFGILSRSGVSIDVCQRHDAAALDRNLTDAEVVVDALLGTGATGEPRAPLDAVIDQLNASAARRLAIDLPSGLDCDTGIAARHTIRASHTFTFVATKPGFLTPQAAAYTGQVHVCDIGVPLALIAEVANS